MNLSETMLVLYLACFGQVKPECHAIRLRTRVINQMNCATLLATNNPYTSGLKLSIVAFSRNCSLFLIWNKFQDWCLFRQG